MSFFAAALSSAADQVRAFARTSATNAQVAQAAMVLARKYVTNAAEKEDTKYHTIRMEDAEMQAKVAPCPGAVELLSAAGFARP